MFVAILLGFLLGHVLALLSTLVQLAVLSRTDVRLVVQVFVGPTLLERRLGRTKVVLGSVPLPTYTIMNEAAAEEAGSEPPPSPWGRSRPLGVFLQLTPLLVLLCAASISLGPARFVDSFGGAFAQLARGALSPTAVGADLARGFLSLLASSGPLVFAGVLAAKLLALNVLPIPSLPIFHAFTTLTSLDGPPGARLMCLQWLGLFVVLGLYLSWALAFGVALLGS